MREYYVAPLGMVIPTGCHIVLPRNVSWSHEIHHFPRLLKLLKVLSIGKMRIALKWELREF